MNSIESLQYLFERDLDRLQSELEAYKNEADLWVTSGKISNSGGNLIMHLIGNLNHFIGHVIGETDYKRDRELEFSGKQSKAELTKSISETKKVVANSLAKLNTEKLSEDFPLQLFDKKYSYITMLIHLSGHLNYHLGQINYHRRLSSK